MTKVRYSVLVILLSYFGMANYANWQTPLSVGPDETAHFLFARFLYQKNYLPLDVADRDLAGYKSDQPPLNAAITAMSLFWYSNGNKAPFVKLNDNPRHQLIVDDFKSPAIKQWLAVNTIDPATGEIFIWRWGRWLSILWSTLTLIVIYRIAHIFFKGWPHRASWATATMTSVAFLPSFIFIGSVFSYENLLGLWLALYLWVALELFMRPHFSIKLSFLAGLFIGLAIITKLSALIAPTSFIILWALKYPTNRTRFLSLLSGLLGIFAGAGWWFGLIIWQLNQIQELGWIKGIIVPIINADGSDEASSQILAGVNITQFSSNQLWSNGLNHLMQTFWVRNTEDFYPVMGWVMIVVTIGLAYAILQYAEIRPLLIFLVAHGLLFVIFPIIRLIATQKTSVAMQGQHVLIPALAVFALCFTLGLGGWWPQQGYRGGVLLGLSLACYSFILIGQISHVPVPIRTVKPYLPASATVLEKKFDFINLLGYELHFQPQMLNLKLYFLTKELMANDYLISTQVINQQGQPVTAWLGHGLNGLAPTRAWEPDDTIYQETWLPLVGLTEGTYTLTLMIENITKELIPLTTFTLTTPPAENDCEVTIWEQGQPTSKIPTFRERTTIQVTANQPVNLVDADGNSYPPNLTAKNTSLYVVDPLWPRGDYQIKTENTALPLKINTTHREVTAPANPLPQAINIANFISLLAYQLPQTELQANQAIPIQLYWQAIKIIPANFIMFTRIYDVHGQVWGGIDRLPQNTYSPMLWAKGEIIPDAFTLNLKPNAPEGQYYLDIGFYLPMGQATISLPLVENGKPTEKNSITLGPFTINP